MSFTFDSRSRRDFRIAVAARALSLFGDLLTIVTLTLLLQARGERPWVLAAMFSAGLLPILLLAPVTGRLVDTVDSRTLLVAAGLGATAASVALAFAPSTPWLLGLAAVVGALTGVLTSTWSALVPAIVGRDHVAAASGVTQTASAAAMLVAPAAAGTLTGWLGYRPPLLLDAATFAAVAVAGLMIRTRRRPERRERPVRAREGWQVVRHDRTLRTALTLLAAFVVLANCINVTDIFLIRTDLGLGPAWFGLFGAAWGAGAVVGGVVAARVGSERGQARLLVAGCALICPAAVALAVSTGATWLIPIGLVGGFGNGWTNASANALFMLRSPETVRGRVSAAIGAVMSGSQLVAYALGAVLADSLTPRSVLMIVGVGGAIVTVWRGAPLLKSVRPRTVGWSDSGQSTVDVSTSTEPVAARLRVTAGA